MRMQITRGVAVLALASLSGLCQAALVLPDLALHGDVAEQAEPTVVCPCNTTSEEEGNGLRLGKSRESMRSRLRKQLALGGELSIATDSALVGRNESERDEGGEVTQDGLDECPYSLEWTRGILSVKPVGPGLCGYDWEKPSNAGFFEIDPHVHKSYFFWAHEARQTSPSNKTVLWLTGGPGCSSGLAMLTENGPCTAQSDGSTLPNPYGWNVNATVIWVDQPAGAGFSTSDVTGRDHNEEEVSRDLYRFLQALWKDEGAPHVAGTELTIMAESYGGHYAPALAKVVTDANAILRSLGALPLPAWMQTDDVHIILTGVGIGNGLTVPGVQYEYYPAQGYDYASKVLGHPVLSEAQVASMRRAWPVCKAAIDACQATDPLCAPAEILCNWDMIGPYQQTGLSPYDMRMKCAKPPLCIDVSGVTTFFNRDDVRSALGIPSTAEKWEPCNMLVNLDFASDWMKRFDADLVPVLGNGTRVLVYAGDMDYICNHLGNEAWVLGLDWPGHDAFNNAPVTPWTVDGENAGDARSCGGLLYLRVSNAGHMVPADVPRPALQLLNTLLFDEPFSQAGCEQAQ